MGVVPSEKTIKAQPTLLSSTLVKLLLSHRKFWWKLRGLSSSDKSLSGNKCEITLQSVYDICISLCTQVLDQAKEIQHLKAHIKKLKKQAKPVVKHHKAWMKKNVLLKKVLARKRSFYATMRVGTERFLMIYGFIWKLRLCSQVEGRGQEIDEWMKKKENAKDVLCTDSRKNEGLLMQKSEGTDEQSKGTVNTEMVGLYSDYLPPTSTIFECMKQIAQVISNMSQDKAVSREKEKGVEFKDIEETERPRPTSTRLLLTLKTLLKIDPKYKRKKKIEEEDESESKSDGFLKLEEVLNSLPVMKRNGIEERAKFLHDTIAAQRKFLAQQRSEAIRNRPPTKNQLRNQMMTYLKHVGNFKHSDLKTKKFEEIQALYEKIKRSDKDFISIGYAEEKG
ncbi:hypothetical protein Tco_1105545 [Tanacetum coccineum]